MSVSTGAGPRPRPRYVGRFSEDEIWNIVALHAQGVSLSQIAEVYESTWGTIRHIVTGQTYKAVTCASHRDDFDNCPCLRCTIVRRADRNLKVTGGQTSVAICIFCEKPAAYPMAKRGPARRGEVTCALHGGRNP